MNNTKLNELLENIFTIAEGINIQDTSMKKKTPWLTQY